MAYGIKVSDGSSLVTPGVKIADGSGGLTAAGGLKSVKNGYSSVSQMLSQSVMYCAHRGGSYDFPEMSFYAYGQSALAGYPALEISLARSSDGVWFGLHDASLDRTTLGTGGGSGTTYVASAMTWSQIQAYNILGSTASHNPSQPSRPYLKFTDLLDMYYDSHVIFVDPKVAVSYCSEVLDIMDSYPNSTTKFIAKYYGVSGGAGNTSGWNFQAKARGYKTWGYFYDTDSANYATYCPRWDILGLNYNAAASYWTSILSYGKPVLGHICPTAAAANTALAQGASGIMASGTLEIVPPAIV